jgi:hypothetical protein
MHEEQYSHDTLEVSRKQMYLHYGVATSPQQVCSAKDHLALCKISQSYDLCVL